MTKKTLQGTRRKKIRTSGFRKRMQLHSGRRIIQLRRAKGRKKLSIS